MYLAQFCPDWRNFPPPRSTSQIPHRGVLDKFLTLFHQRMEPQFQALQPEIRVQRQRQFFGLLFQRHRRIGKKPELVLRALPLRDIRIRSPLGAPHSFGVN